MQSFYAKDDTANPSFFTKDWMRRMKRLSIEFLRREVSLTVEGSALHGATSQAGSQDAAEGVATVCPACGGAWMTALARAEGETPADLERVQQALGQLGLHFQLSQTGQIRICRRSYEEIKETF
jgi:hypothetical protein